MKNIINKILVASLASLVLLTSNVSAESKSKLNINPPFQYGLYSINSYFVKAVNCSADVFLDMRSDVFYVGPHAKDNKRKVYAAVGSNNTSVGRIKNNKLSFTSGDDYSVLKVSLKAMSNRSNEYIAKVIVDAGEGCKMIYGGQALAVSK